MAAVWETWLSVVALLAVLALILGIRRRRRKRTFHEISPVPPLDAYGSKHAPEWRPDVNIDIWHEEPGHWIYLKVEPIFQPSQTAPAGRWIDLDEEVGSDTARG